MKKILIILLCCLFFTGCSKGREKDIVKEIDKKINNYNSYTMKGTMKVLNNEDAYNYSVTVDYKKGDYYKVSLVNNENQHEQVILKNEEGVYIVTPTLNKSFKFQSEWPNNGSQTYILKSILEDIKKDAERSIEPNKNDYVLKTKVSYPNNSNLEKQVVTFDKNLELKSVEVINKSGNSQIVFTVTNFEGNSKLNKEVFDLSSLVKETANEVNTEETNKELESVIYPMYLPVGTTFEGEETITNDNSERVILTYSGDKSFIMVQEPSSNSNDMEVTSVSGELVTYGNIIGVMTDTSLNWNDAGIDYYLIGSNLSSEELLQIASSTATVAVSATK